MTRKSERLTWLIIFVMTLAAGLHTAFFAKTFPDELEYWALAQNLAERGVLSLEGAEPSAYRPPFLAVIISPIAAAGGDMQHARLFLIIFYALAGISAAQIARQLAPENIILPPLTTFLVMAHPAYFFAAGNLYPQLLHVPLLLVMLLVLLRERGLSGAFHMGILSAAALLTAANIMFALLAFYIVLVSRDIGDIRRGQWLHALRTAVAVAVCLMALTPWFYRNHTRVHPGIYLTLNTGINLLLGNSPATRPNSGVDVDLSGYEPSNIESMTEYELNRHYTRAAIANIREEPLRYVRLYFAKVLNGLNNSAGTVTHGAAPLKSMILWSYSLLIWAGALAAAFFLLKEVAVPSLRLHETRLLVGVTAGAYLLNILGLAIFFTRLRFRIPADALLATAAAVGILLLVEQATRLSRPASRRTSNEIL